MKGHDGLPRDPSTNALDRFCPCDLPSNGMLRAARHQSRKSAHGAQRWQRPFVRKPPANEKHEKHEKRDDLQKPLFAAVLHSLEKQQTGSWSQEKWEATATTLLQGVRTEPTAMAELVRLLMFWAKASARDSREIASPLWNEWLWAEELLTMVLDEVCQQFEALEAVEMSPQLLRLLRSLCKSCLDLQLALPKSLANGLAHRVLPLSLEHDLLTAVDTLGALCALDPNHVLGLGSVRKLVLLLKARPCSKKLPDDILKKLIQHVGPGIPATMRHFHSMLIVKALNGARVNHALLRYALYLHLCGNHEMLCGVLSTVPTQVLCSLQRAVAPVAVVAPTTAPSLRSLTNQPFATSSALEKDVIRALQAMLRRGLPGYVPRSLEIQCHVLNTFILDIILRTDLDGSTCLSSGSSVATAKTKCVHRVGRSISEKQPKFGLVTCARPVLR